MSNDIFDYIKENKINEVKLLLEHGETVNIKSNHGNTPLYCASYMEIEVHFLFL